VEHPLWWQGPPWLLTENGPWTVYGDDLGAEDLPEKRVRVQAATIDDHKNEEPELLQRYSSLQRLLQITSWCRRWLPGRRQFRSSSVDAGELEDTRLHWMRLVQAAKYKEELSALRGGKPLSKRSSLVKLGPFLDEVGVLRVGGRLRHARMPFDQAHPIILPALSRITHLIIDAYHRRTLHGGV